MKFVATRPTAEQRTVRRCIGYASDSCHDAPASSTRFAPSCWNAGSPCRQGIGFLRTELPTILATRARSCRRTCPCRRGVSSRLAPAGSAHRWPVRRDRGSRPSRSACSRLMTVPRMGRSRQRHGGHDRHWRGLLQRPRLRAPGSDWCPNDLDGSPHDPRQNLEARRSLPARSVRAGGVGCAGQVTNWERYGLDPGRTAKRRLRPTCSRSRSPTSSPASLGQCWLKDAPSS